jgi:hypothetical protein
MEYIQTHVASAIVGKSQKSGAGVRLHGFVTSQRSKWENTADLIDEKYTEMVLFVAQMLEIDMGDLWAMPYPEFLRLLVKADEIAEMRMNQIEKAKSK